MHGERNYPTRKENSDLDTALPDKTEDALYLKTVRDILPRLIDEVEPDIVFYLSGVDILESDKLGRLSVSIPGCKERDKIVLETCKKKTIYQLLLVWVVDTVLVSLISLMLMLIRID